VAGVNVNVFAAQVKIPAGKAGTDKNAASTEPWSIASLNVIEIEGFRAKFVASLDGVVESTVGGVVSFGSLSLSPHPVIVWKAKNRVANKRSLFIDLPPGKTGQDSIIDCRKPQSRDQNAKNPRNLLRGFLYSVLRRDFFF